MLLKPADDKSKRVHLLEELGKSDRLDYAQKKWVREELSRFRKGIQGERDAAHYLDNYFRDQPHVVLHDLRFVVDGEVAQIDHLIINRVSGIYLIETKNFGGSLHINAHGEFTAIYPDERFGIESPIEQSKRHERVLVRLLERLNITGRTQKAPDFYHVVLVHPRAVIERPSPKEFDTGNVIKADQFPAWHQKFTDGVSTAGVFKQLLNARSADTVKEWAEKLRRQHRPADLLALPDFMRPRSVAEPVAPYMPRPAPTPMRTVQVQPEPSMKPGMPAAVRVPEPGAETAEPPKRLICAHCQSKISYPEGKFCWNNTKRFGGLQYCREHQALFS